MSNFGYYPGRYQNFSAGDGDEAELISTKSANRASFGGPSSRPSSSFSGPYSTAPSAHAEDHPATEGLLHAQATQSGFQDSSADPFVDPGRGKNTKDFQPDSVRIETPRWGLRTPPFLSRYESLQTQYGDIETPPQKALSRNFSKRTQFVRLFRKILFRWAASLVLAVAILACFWKYEKMKVLDKGSEQRFNAVSTALCLALGLNIAASFRTMATMARWKLCAMKKRPLDEIDFVLGISSLVKVFEYGVHVASRQPSTTLVCCLWILVNGLGRLSVALAGLACSFENGEAVSLKPGTVNVTDWMKFSEDFAGDDPPTPSAERYAAHSYGLLASGFGIRNHDDAKKSDHDNPFEFPLERGSNGDWIYHFREFNPTADGKILAHASDRYVQVSASCEYFSLVEGQQGDSSEVSYRNGTDTVSLKAVSDFGPKATTWVNPRSDLPRNAAWDCGKRCTAVAALQFLDKDEEGDGEFYDCEVRVSTTFSAKVKEHELPDSAAEVAGGAIAFEGYSTGPDEWEYVRYPPDSPWSKYGFKPKDAQYMAGLVGKFAAGSIAARDLFGVSTVQVQGEVASTGVALKVNWIWLLLTLGTILACQMAMGVIAVFYSNTVFCKDDSYLSISKLLRPVVDQLGPGGCALTGKEIARTLPQCVVYGVRTDPVGMTHHVDIGADVVPRARMPEGRYDGA